MNQINIYEAKKNFSALIKRVSAGETIMISNHNKPVAELKPIEQKKKTKRPHGLCKGQFVVSEDFNNPLSDEILDLFYGKEEPIR